MVGWLCVKVYDDPFSFLVSVLEAFWLITRNVGGGMGALVLWWAA